MRRKMGACVVVLLFCWAFTGRAQVTTGTISGTVTDSTGAVMPGAKIVIQNEDTGISRTVATDAAGRYLAPSLGLGNYRVTGSMEGFQTEVRRGIVLTVGREAVVNLQLSVGAVTQTVEVTGEAPLVQTTEAAVSYLVNDKTMRDLPLNGRDMSELILLNPGVNWTTNGPAGNSYNGWGKKVSIGGMRGEDNAYLLDGTYINDMNHHIPSGPSGSLLGVETVREFQVLTNSYGAQYGRTLGGVFNAVTKSGTNEWHGNAYEFLRNSSLDARNFFDTKLFPSDPRLPAFRRNQFGATLGGPIKKDKTFFFAAYEGTRERLSSTIINVVPTANARLGILPTGNVPVSDKIKPYLSWWPLPSPQGRDFGDGTAQYIRTASQPTTDDFGQARMDHQISDADSFFGRFTASNSLRDQPENYAGYSTLQALKVRLFSLTETHIFSPRMLNNFRASFNRIDPSDTGVFPTRPAALLSFPGQPPPELAPGSGITSMAGYPRSRNYWTTNRFQFYDDVNLTLGSHSLQFGGMVERMQFNMDFQNRNFGVWTFSSLTNFLAATPTTYRGTPQYLGNSVRGFRSFFFALYLQDDWKVTPKLTLNLGLRWEPYTVAKEVNGLVANQRNLMDPANTVGDPYWLNQSWWDFGPRFGFAWNPFASGKTSVRGGFGIIYMPNDGSAYRGQTDRNPTFFPELTSPDKGFFPDGVATVAAIQETSFGVTEAIPFDNWVSAHTLQYSLNVQREFGASNMLTVAYTGARGINNSSFGNYNIPLAVFDGVSLAVPAGAKVFNDKFTQIAYYATNANAWYNAFSAAFQRRFSRGLQMQVSYTFGKSLSEADGTAKVEYSGSGSGTVPYAHDMGAFKGLSGFHVSHAFNVNYSYELPFGRDLNGVARHLLSGWQLTGIARAQTGQPFTLTATAPRALSDLGYSCCAPNRILGHSMDQIIQGGPEQYFNPQAYSAPGSRQLGNAGRNPLIGPGLGRLDFGMTKNTTLTERWQLQFRAEVFNLTNRANFGIPARGLFTGTGGRVGSAGSITRTVDTARQLQFSLKLLF